jgi:O-acetyl-ADP-ribose deacetylase (regulator of RNase III)
MRSRPPCLLHQPPAIAEESSVIHFLTGDILLSQSRAIAHGVAPADHFDSGLALALRERWPAMVKDFRHHCQQSHPKPGTIWTWAGADGVRIVNLLTQEPAPAHHARPGKASLTHVNHALRDLARFVEAEKVASLALPRLATGVGGLDWNDVRPLIEKHLGAFTIPVCVYETYKPGVAAQEPETG